MKNLKRLLTAVILTAVCSMTLAQGSWKQLTSFPGVARNNAVGFTVSGYGYIGTGYDGTNRLKDVWRYDPVTKTWAQKNDYNVEMTQCIAFVLEKSYLIGTGISNSVYYKDMWAYKTGESIDGDLSQKANFAGNARSKAVSFSINGLGYVCAGFDGTSYYKDLWEYNLNTNTWTKKANFPGNARMSPVAFVINGEAYVGTGYDNVNYYKDFYKYNPISNTWAQVADFGGGERQLASAFAIGNYGYVVGGYDGATKSDCYRYNSLNNSWEKVADYGGGNTYAAVAFAIGNKGYVGTGHTGSGRKADFWEYTPDVDSSNVWKRVGLTPFSGTSDANSFGIDNKIYFTTGYNGSAENAIWEYNTETKIWTEKASFGGGGRAFPAGFVLNGKIYLGTGIANNVEYSDLWEFDPLQNQWTQKKNVPGTVRTRAIGFTAMGKGYIGLGRNGTTYLQDLYEYTSGTDTWKQVTSFPGGVRSCPNVFVVNDSAYIGCGFDGTNYYKDFWMYSTATDKWIQKKDYPGKESQMGISFVIDGKAYVGTGVNVGDLFSDLWEYTPSKNEWNRKNDIGSGSIYSTQAVAIGNTVYTIAGHIMGANRIKEVWCYSPVKNIPIHIQSNSTNTFCVKVYPNPVKNKLQIELQNAGIKTRYEIYTISGTLLVKGKIVSTNHQIDFDNFASGSYILKIYQGTQTFSQKIIKE